jgi:hypothetical protein
LYRHDRDAQVSETAPGRTSFRALPCLIKLSSRFVALPSLPRRARALINNRSWCPPTYLDLHTALLNNTSQNTMDPLSLTVSIATLISMAGSVLSKCYTYGYAVAGASEEKKNLLNEITNLCGILAGLKSLLEAGGMSYSHVITMSETLRQCETTLKGLGVLLEKSMSGANSGAGKTFKRMMWPLKSKDIVPILARLERQKAAFTNIMAQDSV